MSTLTVLGMAVPAAAPPVQCGLYNSMAAVFGVPVGQIMGLANFAPWIAGGLAVALILLSFHPAIRSKILKNLLWLLAAVLIALAIPGIFGAFSTSTC